MLGGKVVLRDELILGISLAYLVIVLERKSLRRVIIWVIKH